MRIHMTYYASLREQRGVDSETLDVDSGSLRALYRRLASAYRFSYSEDHIRPAVNDEFASWERPLSDGDRVVFVSPVAGG